MPVFDNPITGTSDQPNVSGVTGTSTRNNGVTGITTFDGGAGVAGFCNQGLGFGLYGRSQNTHGVWGISLTETPGPGHGVGVLGESHGWNGVRGISYAPGHGAVVGVHANDTQQAGPGVYGLSSTAGVFGESPAGIGVVGTGKLAGKFVGDVEVTGDIRLTNMDYAEDFDIAAEASVDPGTVMVLAAQGQLRPSEQAYDKRVAGIISGAGDYQPALVLGRLPDGNHRQPIALIGKVFCKVDAAYGPVEIGDLLTTSPTPRHAMKAADPLQAFGAVLGKALRPLTEGQDLIPVLVTLQ